MSATDHNPTHPHKRDTDDDGTTWLRRTGFWAAETVSMRDTRPPTTTPERGTTDRDNDSPTRPRPSTR